MREKKSIFTITKGTKTVIGVMTVLVLIGILIANSYYGAVNDAEDPRVVEAKHKYKKYQEYVKQNNFESVFSILDSIEGIYSAHKDYKQSFEMGVVQNNKAAAWLTLAISEQNDSLKKNYLSKAKEFTNKGIEILENWIKEFKTLSKKDIQTKVGNYYNPNDGIYKNFELENIIEKRVQDIVQAQTETDRRLSVAYTNLGTIFRHSDDYNNAMLHNKKALDLWPDNLTAKNNINILLGRPLEERSTLDKLFPKSKDKD